MLDLHGDPVALTQTLVDIPSVSGTERQLAQLKQILLQAEIAP